MQFRLKTSKQTAEIFNSINQREHIQPFALAKIAIMLAIKEGYKAGDKIVPNDTDGLELNRQTITGENDDLFKALIEVNEGEYLEEDIYFPYYIKSYLDYGAFLLEQEVKYSRNIYSHLVNLEKGI